MRAQLRGSRTPDRVVFRDELPTNATGKVLRRELVDELNADQQGVSMIKNGTRLQSQVCDTQVIVVRSADSLDDLRAGGAPMVPDRRRTSTPSLTLDADFSDGTLMGKRYVDDGGAEVLVTKAGAGHAQHRHHAAGDQGSQAAARQRLTCRGPMQTVSS